MRSAVCCACCDISGSNVCESVWPYDYYEVASYVAWEGSATMDVVGCA